MQVHRCKPVARRPSQPQPPPPPAGRWPGKKRCGVKAVKSPVKKIELALFIHTCFDDDASANITRFLQGGFTVKWYRWAWYFSEVTVVSHRVRHCHSRRRDTHLRNHFTLASVSATKLLWVVVGAGTYIADQRREGSVLAGFCVFVSQDLPTFSSHRPRTSVATAYFCIQFVPNGDYAVMAKLRGVFWVALGRYAQFRYLSLLWVVISLRNTENIDIQALLFTNL